MSDRFPSDLDQEDSPFAPELARLDALLLREGERWRRDEPSTARLERHIQALTQRGAAERLNGHDREDMMLAERNPVTQLPTPHGAPERHSARSRWRGLLPAVAAVLVVALAGSIFALFGAHHIVPGRATATATPTITRVTAVRPSQPQLPLPARAFLAGMSFSSAHDGWVVGGNYLSDQPSSTTRTVLIHYHDGVWTASSDTIPHAYLSSISMISEDDGWAVGMTDSPQTSNTNGAAFLLHYTGGHWQRVDPPALTDMEPESLPTIHMVSPGFGYLSGTVMVPEPGSGILTTRLLILVYENGTWTAIPNTFAYGNGAVMVSPSEGWVAAGNGGSTGVIYHYLNGVWTKTATASGLYWTLTLGGPRDIWASGLNCVQRQCTPVMYHYNGVSWSSVSMPAIPGFDIGYLGATRVALTADAADDVWYSLGNIVSVPPPGQWRYQDDLYAFSRGAWTHQSLPISDGEVSQLTTDGNGGTWAIMISPLAGDAILYTSGDGWSVYGQG